MRSTQRNLVGDLAALPLTLPRELWVSLSPAQQAVYRRAESLLSVFNLSRSAGLSQLLAQGPRAEVLRALQVLGGMSLVDIESEDSDAEPTVTLRALPDEHLRVIGPDGKPRWIFVARPLDPPNVDSSSLN
ncbi:MAG TPA: hypothetical protein VER33_19175 [Polyangiaceae bacterium]|nr:hypothetical protein [Polyangiaceae bacterium]